MACLQASSVGIQGKVALVTGATSGIGMCCARRMASLGCKVYATGRNKAALEQVIESGTVAAKVSGAGGKILGSLGDVSVEADVKKIVDDCMKKYGRIDILVNSAGVIKGGPIDQIDVANFDFNMNVNARGVFMFMALTADALKSSKGSIVNVSSVNGQQSFGGCLSYCASKAAVDMMTKCAAIDLAPYGVRVNAVNPGVVVTALHRTAGMSADTYAAFLKRSVNVTHPLGASTGTVASDDDVTNAILFFADTTKSAFSTGSTLRVDGGRGCLGAR